jgi:hypothetical protein
MPQSIHDHKVTCGLDPTEAAVACGVGGSVVLHDQNPHTHPAGTVATPVASRTAQAVLHHRGGPAPPWQSSTTVAILDRRG